MGSTNVTEIESESVTLEKSLQQLIDRHLPRFFGVRFLASEHATGRTHGGRIDTLGIDENGSPVSERVRDEVHALALVKPGRRVEVQAPRGSDALADAPAHGEPLRSVDAVDELVVMAQPFRLSSSCSIR